MTHRQRILTVLGGGRADKVPWFPDLSYWLEVNRRGGTLPGDLADCDLPELHRRLDAGLPVHLYNSHASGLDGRYGPLITFEYEGVEQTVSEGSNERRTEIVTPVGRLVDRRKRVIELESPFVVEHQVKSVEDFAAVEYLYTHRRLSVDGEKAGRLEADLDGLVFWDLVLPRAPLTSLLIDLAGVEAGIYMLFDEPARCERLFEVIEQANAELLELLAGCPGAVCIFADNVDNVIVSPRLFRQYLLGYYQRWTDFLHQRGKLCACHMDGRLRGLLGMLKDTGLDIIDGATPAPMNDFEPSELSEGLSDGMRAWCGVPSTMFCDGTSVEEVIDFASGIVDALGDRVILNVGDQLPPNGDIEKVRALGRWASQFSW